MPGCTSLLTNAGRVVVVGGPTSGDAPAGPVPPQRPPGAGPVRPPAPGAPALQPLRRRGGGGVGRGCLKYKSTVSTY